MESHNVNRRRKRIMLIFNPVSGANKDSPVQLMDVIKELQAWKLVPEPYLTEPDTDYAGLIRDAMEQGIRMFVVCGGDGTVSAVARAMAGTTAVLGIIPNGTQNNVALSLGIPADIPAAIKVLRTGKRLKIDIGMVTSGDMTIPFLEVCSVGLFSALFSSGDEIQHGNITRIGDFLATLTSSSASKIRLLLDNKIEARDSGHVVLVSNMPYIGRHYQVGADDSYSDGFLDVLFCADVPKFDLVLGYILKVPDAVEDPRIQHYKARSVVIETEPAMPVMADGIELNQGTVKIGIRRHALTVMTVPEEPDIITESGDKI